jgi:hypothetical protein
MQIKLNLLVIKKEKRQQLIIYYHIMVNERLHVSKMLYGVYEKSSPKYEILN